MQSTTYSKIIGLLFAATSLQAETAVTETEFLAAMGSDHPAAVALRAPLGQAQADRAEAKILGNPNLRFDREEPDQEPRETVWSLAWRAPLDGRYGLGIDAADEGLGAAENRLAAEMLNLRMERRRVFASWLLAEGRRALLDRHHERLQGLAIRMSSRAEIGEESELEARRFELAATVVAAELGKAEASLVQAETAAFLWNPVMSSDSRPVLEALPEVPTAVDSRARPDLLAKQDDLDRTQIEARLSRRFWSFPELYAGWKTIRDSSLDVDLAGPVFGFDWQFPLFDRRQADKQQNEVELEAALAELTWSTDRASRELEAALRVYETLRATANQTRSVATRSNEVLRMGAASFAQGEYTTTDLLEIWSSVVTVQLKALDLEYETLAAHREIEAASGQALPLGGRP